MASFKQQIAKAQVRGKGFGRGPAGWNPGTPGAGADAGGGGGGALPFQAAFNSMYETSAGVANRNYQDQLAQAQARETAVRGRFGFDPHYANDPYTRASMLRDSWQKSRRGASTGLAARGQLYSGALTNALGYADEGYARGTDQAQREYQEELSGVTSERLGAERELREAMAAAEAKRIEDMIEGYKNLDTSGVATPEPQAARRPRRRRR